MEAPAIPTDEQLKDLFEVTPEDAGLSPCNEPELKSVEIEAVQDVRDSLKDWAESTGHTENLYPRFTETFSACVARSKQCDRDIEKYGELSAEISLGYMEQSMTLWHQMTRLTEKRRKNENDN